MNDSRYTNLGQEVVHIDGPTTTHIALAADAEKAHFLATMAGSPLNAMAHDVHQANVDAGWWTDLATGQRKDRNVGELLMLVVSEVSEAMEGHRKGLMDDKLPHRTMFEVELADVFIRIFDIAGAHKLDLDGAVREKLAYNAKREDHKIEARQKDGGKKY
jgi:NTP pyrophosphatase (non-canonical NTP hydrolase)